MMYLIGQILCCLLIAALLGFVIGWLLKGWFGKNEKGVLEKELKESEKHSRTLQEDLERIKAKLNECEKRLIKQSTVAPVTNNAVLDKTNVKDDLKKIKGIGRVIEGVLYNLKITSFRQIAQFNDQDIKMVAESLDVFPGRIVRDNWVAQAKELHFIKYQERL